MKFGISFTLTHLNQAGALVHVYTDGSVHLNHGGTEMGQGLYTKVAQVVAEEFGIDASAVRITATTTGKVPNTSATAASSGADLNGMAAKQAAATIKSRLIDFAATAVEGAEVAHPLRGWPGADRQPVIAFGDLARQAHIARISLSSTGYYATPKIHWDRAKAKGRPFFYFAYGAACSEVTIDTLTGEMRVDRVDILHDVGRSLNPALDIGQVEGGFVQGMGWLTTEELVYDAAGQAPHPCAVHLQDPLRLRRSGGFPGEAVRKPRQQGGYDLPLQGRGRTAAHAGHFRMDGDFRRRRQPEARADSRGSMRRPRLRPS